MQANEWWAWFNNNCLHPEINLSQDAIDFLDMYAETDWDLYQNNCEPEQGGWPVDSGEWKQKEFTSCEDPNIPISEPECETLVAIYNALDGDNRGTDESVFPPTPHNAGWKATNNMCDRNGIFCGRDENTQKYVVSQIHLYGSNLNGTLPNLSNLPNLTHLFLGHNDGSQLQIDLSHLAWLTLEQLAIQNVAAIHGNLDHLASSAGSLTHLWANQNEPEDMIQALTYTPAQLAQFTQLETVYLDNNIIQWDIDSLANLTQIQELILNCRDVECSAFGDLAAISQLTSLQRLEMGRIGNLSQWAGIAAIANLSNLHTVKLQGNQLWWVLPNLTTRENLRHFEVHNNNISWPLPEFHSSNSINYLDISWNDFSGTVPASWSNLTELERLGIGAKALNNRKITWTMPSLANMDKLENLLIYGTKLTGPLPDINTTSLKNIWVIFNNFTSIPTSRSSLTEKEDMDYFMIYNNNLSWPLPAWFEDIHYDFDIMNNCFAIDGLDEEFIDHLEEYADDAWMAQNNCLSSIQITKTLNTLHPILGDPFTLTIGYHNLWPEVARNVTIATALDPAIQILSTTPQAQETIVNKQYFVEGDICYDDAFQWGWYSEIVSLYLREEMVCHGFEMCEAELSTAEKIDMTFMGVLMMADLEVTVAQITSAVGNPDFWTGGALTLLVWLLINNAPINQGWITFGYQNFDVLLESMMGEFGLSQSNFPECGLWGDDGYQRSFESIWVGASWAVTMELLLPIGSEYGNYSAVSYLNLQGSTLLDTVVTLLFDAIAQEYQDGESPQDDEDQQGGDNQEDQPPLIQLPQQSPWWGSSSIVAGSNNAVAMQIASNFIQKFPNISIEQKTQIVRNIIAVYVQIQQDPSISPATINLFRETLVQIANQWLK
jgi:hypothetical protein